MTPACSIVDRLLETEDVTPGMISHYLTQAGDWVLLVPDPLPADPHTWFVMTRPVTDAHRIVGTPSTRVPGAHWQLASTHPTKEAAVEAAHAFLKAHGKTP